MATRRVYIVPEGYDPIRARTEAAANNCSEFAVGIPLRLRNQIQPRDLPRVHEEADEGAQDEAVALTVEDGPGGKRLKVRHMDSAGVERAYTVRLDPA